MGNRDDEAPDLGRGERKMFRQLQLALGGRVGAVALLADQRLRKTRMPDPVVVVLVQSYDPSHERVRAVREPLRPPHHLVLRAVATRAPPVRTDAGIKALAVGAVECQEVLLRWDAHLAIAF